MNVANTLHGLPNWVPEGAQRYLAHTEAGLTIREIARISGCHASTILRQIRKVETLRDDPLIDSALRKLGDKFGPSSLQTRTYPKVTNLAIPSEQKTAQTPDIEELNREAVRILRRLCERGAVLAVASDLDKAVVVRENNNGASQRTAVVERNVAEAMALKDWISAAKAGRITRYSITNAGRQALETIMGEPPKQRHSHKGFAEAPAAFADQHRSWDEKSLADPETGSLRKVRYNLSESPLTALARRRDKSGQPFLSDDLVGAGERLREDFELAQMGPRVAQNWDRFLAGNAIGVFAADSGVGNGPHGARKRVASALKHLGPGLGDVVLRCCCFLEGLENAEKRLGWSARSGKIVLRIALQQLKRHYEGLSANDNMIG
ncbi:MAG: DUF6456 domain-containing protein [Paracoccaceae bacterium]